MKFTFAITLATLLLTMTGSNGEEESPRELWFSRPTRTQRPYRPPRTLPPSRARPTGEEVVDPDAVPVRPLRPLQLTSRPPSRFQRPEVPEEPGQGELVEPDAVPVRPLRPNQAGTRPPSRGVPRTRPPV
jgi:hypothetical protein